jgi:hypothetical protein
MLRRENVMKNFAQKVACIGALVQSKKLALFC